MMPSNQKSSLETASSMKPCKTSLETASSMKPCKTSKGSFETESTMKPCETRLRSKLKERPIEKASETVLMKKRRVMPTDVEELEEIKIEVGKDVDLKRLLSSKTRDFLVSPKDGAEVPISSITDKYVLINCFCVPFDEHGPQATFCHCIEALFSELSLRSLADTVQLVVVLKTPPGSKKADFHRFLDKLSAVNCLAIPFSDSDSRDKVCETLELCPISEDSPCLAVHPSGKVLQHGASFLENFGAQSYPFTAEHFDKICLQDELTRRRLRSTKSPISLEELLQCDSLSRIDEKKSISTSDLRGTPVGLYLYARGDFMTELKDIHQQCLAKGLKFEIVLVPIPFGLPDDPISFCDRMKKAASKEDSITSSWWSFPFNDKTCLTLWRVFHCYNEDELIILPHGGRCGDFYGKQVSSFYGIDSYPFTRDIVVERKVSDLRSFTLQQIMVGDSNGKSNTNAEALVSKLSKKNVLLCLDFCGYDGKLWQTLNEDYREVKARYPECEVVFVPFDDVSTPFRRRLSRMGWHILPPELYDTVVDHIFMEGKYRDEEVDSALVAYGKDGKIQSRHAGDRLPGSDTSDTSLFSDTLASDILAEMRGYHDDMPQFIVLE